MRVACPISTIPLRPIRAAGALADLSRNSSAAAAPPSLFAIPPAGKKTTLKALRKVRQMQMEVTMRNVIMAITLGGAVLVGMAKMPTLATETGTFPNCRKPCRPSNRTSCWWGIGTATSIAKTAKRQLLFMRLLQEVL